MDNVFAEVMQGMTNVIRSRHEAADLLREVADDGQAGCYPEGVKAAAFGQACVRMLVNCPEPDAFDAFLVGVAEARQARGL